MQVFGIFVVIFLIVGFVYTIYDLIYRSTNHTRVDDPEKLRANATVVAMKHEKSGSRNDVRYRTTVDFSDGFHYITFKTTVKSGFGHYTISMGPELKLEIMGLAQAAHDKALQKAQEKAAAGKR